MQPKRGVFILREQKNGYVFHNAVSLPFQPKPLFQKIEPSLAGELKKRFAGKQESRPSPEKAGQIISN